MTAAVGGGAARCRRSARRRRSCRSARASILHRDPDRFGLLYRLLWRFQVEPGLRADPLDPDWLRADEMAQAVRRDMHKMKAFVRFRTLADADDERGAPLHVAWFEPEHHIVEATAPFFARRFTADALGDPDAGAQRPLGRRAALASARARGATRRRPPMPARSSGSPTTRASSIRRA